MPPLSLKDAAEATGKNKATIFRSIKAGRLSAQRDVFGQWMIDPSELFRVYDPVSKDTQQNVDDTQEYVGGAQHDNAKERNAKERDDGGELHCEVVINLLRELLEERDRLLVERDKRIADQGTMIEGLENVVSDLMVRLDQEAADRRRAYALTGLLTDQRTPTEKSKHWWQRWFT